VNRLWVLAALALALNTGCANGTRPEIRSAVLHTAYSLKLADKSCADTADALAKAGSGKAAIQLAESCDTAYTNGRAGLIAAEAAIDAKGDLDAGKVACAISKSVSGLKELVKAVSVYAEMPPQILDGIERGEWLLSLGGDCK
jgi:hypothetical protein